MTSTPGTTVGTLGSAPILRRISAYKDAIRLHVPALPPAYLDTWPLLEHDVLAIHKFLDVVEGDSDFVAVDVGTFLGLSAYALALHPRVERVISIDTNPRIADEVAKTNVIDDVDGVKALGPLRVLEAAHSVLSSFPEEAAKIDVLEGALDAALAGDSGSQVNLQSRVAGAPVFALVDGLHTAEGVASDLEAIFSASPNAVAVLDDCRHVWGPDVQSGVAKFLRAREGAISFKLLVDVSASFVKSNLGFVYASDDERVPRALAALHASHADFDPLALIGRNEELLRISAEQHKELIETRGALNMMQHSRSWKVTAPLRVVDAALRRHGG